MSALSTTLIVGASSEIGAATARRAAALGQACLLTYHRRRAEAESLASSLAAGGIPCRAIACDLRQPNALAGVFAAADESMPPLGSVVFAAAHGGTRTSLLDLESERVEESFRVNALTAFDLLRLAIPRLAASRQGPRGGGIVLVGSNAGISGGRQLAAYATSKSALHLLAQIAAKEAGPLGVRVNAVAPGAIDTLAMRKANQFGPSDPVPKSLTDAIPLGRIGTPDEVAAAILWLLSPDASYVSGVVLPVGGAR